MLLSDAHTAALAEAFPFAGYPNHSGYDRGVERLTLSPGKPPATFSDLDHTYPHDERHVIFHCGGTHDRSCAKGYYDRETNGVCIRLERHSLCLLRSPRKRRPRLGGTCGHGLLVRRRPSNRIRERLSGNYLGVYTAHGHATGYLHDVGTFAPAVLVTKDKRLAFLGHPSAHQPTGPEGMTRIPTTSKVPRGLHCHIYN